MATGKNTKGKARNGGSQARAWHNGLELLESRVLFSAAPLVAELAGPESADGGAAAIEVALVPGDTHPMPVPGLGKEALPVDHASDKLIDPSDCPSIADLIGCPGELNLEHGPGMHDSEIWATEIGSSYIQKGDSGGPGSDAVADPSTEDFWVAPSLLGKLHDSVHCMVGGTMCSARSSSDPIVAGDGPNGEFAIQAASDGLNDTQRAYINKKIGVQPEASGFRGCIPTDPADNVIRGQTIGKAATSVPNNHGLHNNGAFLPWHRG